jgi:hypothetical protein
MTQFLTVEAYAGKYDVSIQEVLDRVDAGDLNSAFGPGGRLLVEDDQPESEEFEEELDDEEEGC